MKLIDRFKNLSSKSKRKLLIFTPLIVILVVLFIAFYGDIKQLFEKDFIDDLNKIIDKTGNYAFIVLIFFQVIQVVIAIIPGGAAEVICGVQYGPWLGSLISLIGIALGEYIIFVSVRKFGEKLVEKAISKEEMSKYKFLKDQKKFEYFIFILFFLPGLPKDILTYLAPLTKISLKRFIIVSMLARLPSIIASSYAGFFLADGNIIFAAILFLIFGVAGILGIFIHEKFLGEKK